VIPDTPYTPELQGRDPLEAMRETIPLIAATVAGWSDEQFDRAYAPGKWTARQVLIHLAQTELALGTRARMALTKPNFEAQSFDQDRWLARESGLTGPRAVDVFVALATLNLSLLHVTQCSRSPDGAHARRIRPMTVDWIIYQKAATRCIT
jgi:hypothetical protein